MSFITGLVALCAIAVSLFPILPLQEGSFLYAILSPAHNALDSYANVFASASLRPYGLAPVVVLALVNFVLALLGSGLFACLFRCTLFAGLALIGMYVQGSDPVFKVLEVLPGSYHFIGLGAFLVSLVFLAAIAKIKAKGRKPVKPAVQDTVESASEVITEPVGQSAAAESEDHASEEVEEKPEPVKVEIKSDPILSKRALASLTDVEVPEFESFQSYSLGSSISSVDRTVYDVAEREAQIKREEQEKRRLLEEQRRKEEEERQRLKAEEEERIRREQEEERIRLANMFKPRTLMKRLNEDAQAEKSFPTYGMGDSDIDYGLSGRTSEPKVETQAPESGPKFQTPEPPKDDYTVSAPIRFAKAEFQNVNFNIPVSQQVPPAQMQNPFTVHTEEVHVHSAPAVEPVVEPETPKTPEVAVEPEREIEVTPPKAVFKEAQEQAEIEEQIALMKRQTEIQKKQIEEFQELERKRKEIEDEKRRVQEELERARAELEKQRQELEAQKQAEPKVVTERVYVVADSKAPAEEVVETVHVQPVQKAAMTVSEEKSYDSEDFEDDSDMIPAASEQAPRKERKKGPDYDEVAGVAGTRNASSGNALEADRRSLKYEFPPQSLLKHYPISAKIYDDVENDPDGRIIVETFKQFRIDTTLVGIQHGPTFTLYELTLQKGVKVTAVLNLADNIAMELSVEAVRILAPIPGKPAIGVEVPNKQRDTIGFDVMMPELTSKNRKIPMVLGKTITGDSIVIDLAKTPHLLVAGTTGSGKSVCINGLICSVLFTKSPKEVRMLLVDPKMVELSLYNGIPHLLTPVITDAKKAIKAMKFIVDEMERRMALFSAISAKNIQEYNEKIADKNLARVKMPYIMVIIDEFADLMLAVGKELEASIKRITAVARFCGIHLVLATQRPSSDVITGIIKSNMPTQIAFAVSNSTNSRIIIDSVGAEKLLGRGDMLYNNPESRTPSRIQGAYIDSEIEEIVNFVKTQGEPDYIDEAFFEDDDEDEEEEVEEGASNSGEDMFTRAWKIVSDRGEASASYLQRRLGIGYNRAANLIEQLEDAGYIGPPHGSKPREILRLYGCE